MQIHIHLLSASMVPISVGMVPVKEECRMSSNPGITRCLEVFRKLYMHELYLRDKLTNVWPIQNEVKDRTLKVCPPEARNLELAQLFQGLR